MNIIDQMKKLPHNEAEAGKFVLANGRLFFPVDLPSSVIRGDLRSCFQSAYRATHGTHGSLVYVEGYAMHPDYTCPLKHAWVTSNGTDAIDPTWPHSLKCLYFGCTFSRMALNALMIRSDYYGALWIVDDYVSKMRKKYPSRIDM